MKPSELLATPDKWCRDAVAKDSDGEWVGSLNPRACQWCVVGSLYHCFDEHTARFYMNEIAREIGYDIGSWNDTPGRTHAEVLALLRRVGL